MYSLDLPPYYCNLHLFLRRSEIKPVLSWFVHYRGDRRPILIHFLKTFPPGHPFWSTYYFGYHNGRLPARSSQQNRLLRSFVTHSDFSFLLKNMIEQLLQLLTPILKTFFFFFWENHGRE